MNTTESEPLLEETIEFFTYHGLREEELAILIGPYERVRARFQTREAWMSFRRKLAWDLHGIILDKMIAVHTTTFNYYRDCRDKMIDADLKNRKLENILWQSNLKVEEVFTRESASRLGFSPNEHGRAKRLFTLKKITNVYELLKYEKESLRDVDYCSKRTLGYIEAVLSERYLSFGMLSKEKA